MPGISPGFLLSNIIYNYIRFTCVNSLAPVDCVHQVTTAPPAAAMPGNNKKEMQAMSNETAAPLAPTKPYHYDHTEVFKRDIEPLIMQVHALCSQSGIPIMLTAQYGAVEGCDMLFSAGVFSDQAGRKLDCSPQIIGAAIIKVAMQAADAGDETEQAYLQANPIMHEANAERARTRAMLEAETH